MRKRFVFFKGLVLVMLFYPLVNVLAAAQNVKSLIILHGESMSLTEAVREIEKSSDYSFFYNSEDLAGGQTKDYNLQGSIDEVLATMFDGTGISYKVNGNDIILSKQSVQQSSKKRTLSGVVVDNNDGTPIIGANVVIKGTSTGGITDIDGNFNIAIPIEGCTVEITYVGYKKYEAYITDQGLISVKLVPDDRILEEVVIVGAGTQKKVSVTGAITSVKGNALRVPSSSLTNNLSGKLSGIISMTNSGEPGSSSEFYIRGISTFGGRTTPLILLDGVEISTNDLNNLPAESIESFSILKDASATAIYGARGANGVMLITTKTGAENTKAKINVTYEHSFMKPVNMVEYADGATFMETYNEALLGRTPSAQPRYSQEQIDNTRNGVNKYVYPDVDWYDLMFKDLTMSQRANVNVSGGGSRVTYYMSLQANHDSGILDVPNNYSIKNNYNRWLYTFQNNIGYKLTSTTKLDLRMNAQIVNSKSPNVSSNDIFNSIYNNNPVLYPAMYPASPDDTHIKFGSAVMSGGKYYENPYAYMLNTFKEENYSKLNVALNLDQKLDFITKGLSLTALVNFNSYATSYYTRSLTPFYYSVVNGSYNPADNTFELAEMQTGTEYLSESGISRNADNTFYFDARLNYNRRFGNHSVTGMLMYMMREYRSDVLPNRNQGFSGRFTYDYGNKYLVEFNFGYNGTERIQKDDRFEFFPAASIGWVISNEDFWEPLKDYVNHLKIRASYGLVGSDETGSTAGAAHFLYLNDVNLDGGQNFQTGYKGETSFKGPFVNSYAVANATWERSKQFDVGVDLRLFDQIDLTFDYFNYKRDHILMQRGSFPYMLGYVNAKPWSNIGKVDNEGVELSVNWRKQLTKDLSVDLRANYTYSKNTQRYVDEPDYPYVWQTNTGKPLSFTKGYICDGFFVDQQDIDTHADQSYFGSTVQPGDLKYRDINADGRITTEDQVMLSPYGNVPRIQYGFGLSLVWKKLDFNVFFNGSAKRRVMMTDMYPFVPSTSEPDHNLMQWIADSHWTEGADNTNAEYPRLGVTDTQIQNNNQPSSFFMRKADFLRFKTLEIGYTLPYCRIYFSGDNLAVWSPFDYWDPELWYNTYPLQRTFNLGVQFNF